MTTLLISLFVSPTLAAPPEGLLDLGIVLSGPDDGLFSEGLNAPAVAYDDSTGLYHLYFESSGSSGDIPEDCATGGGIGHATSVDGLDWDLVAVPALSPVPGTPYGCAVAHPSVLYDGEIFHMFFLASDSPLEGLESNDKRGIGYARSNDGQNFTVVGDLIYENPLLENDSGGLYREGIGMPSAVMVRDSLVVTFVSVPAIHRVFSNDRGETWWNEPDPVFLPSADIPWMSERVVGPSLLCRDTPRRPMLIQYFGGKDVQGALTIGRAKSVTMGHIWSVGTDDTILEPGDVDMPWSHWDAMMTDVGPMFYYSTTDLDGRKAIGLAVTEEDWTEVSGRVCGQ